jgi:cyanate lyase
VITGASSPLSLSTSGARGKHCAYSRQRFRSTTIRIATPLLVADPPTLATYVRGGSGAVHAGAMNRHEVTEQIVMARLARGLGWQQLADAIGRPVVWTTSALLGQQPIPTELGKILVEMLGLDESAVPVLAAPPMRGGLPTAVPTDPTIYRFYEALQVYGGALKELLHEQFGDGIMSAINFSVDLHKKPHPTGDRVVVTFDGKFLPYQWVSGEN